MSELPAMLSSRVGQSQAQIEKVANFLANRLRADLSDLSLVSVTARLKSAPSILQKLQTGKYANLGDVLDLAGLTVVLMYRRDIDIAIRAVRGSNLDVKSEAPRGVDAADFSYREPKLYVRPPQDYLDRNADLVNITAEVQFTSAIQHALDMTTHDFDYKGRTYSWRNFRLVAQLRGMLELVDSMIDDIGKVSMPSNELVQPPQAIIFASAVLEQIESRFDDEEMPSDRRRLAETVAAWIAALEVSSQDFGSILDANPDLLSAHSLDVTTAILGCLLRFDRTKLLNGYEKRFVISAELESLCGEAESVPIDRRVDLSWSL